MTWARAEHNSMYGPIRSAWRIEDGHLILDVTIPPNTTATVYVPARDPRNVTESGGPGAGGVESIGVEPGRAVFAIQSGSYSFKSERP